VRRTRLSKKSKTPVAKVKEKLWESVRDLIRKRDGNKCFICGKEGLAGANWHGGHFIASAICGMYLRYDVRNVHSSCYYCNINLGGNGSVFYHRLVEEYGQDWVNKLFVDKQKTVKWGIPELEQLTAFYQDAIKLTPKKLIKLTKEFNGFEPTQ
jgi:hypothetical protein